MKSDFISSNIRNLRLSYGFTQKQLASVLGCDKSYISHFESGRFFPTLLYCCHLSAFFMVPLYNLLYTDVMKKDLFYGRYEVT